MNNDSITAIGDKVKSLSQLTVYLYINRAQLDFHPDPQNDFKIPGAAFAQKIPGQYLNSEKGYSYYIGIGHWGNARWDENHGWVTFQFLHPKHTPFIENMVLVFFGAEDRVKELLSTADWKLLNDSLTL